MKISSTLSKILLLCSLFTTTCSHAQYILLPDSNFGRYLNNNLAYSSCILDSSVGYFLDTACVSHLSVLDINDTAVHDLTGIQYFKSLRELFCNNTHVITLPPLPDTLNILNCSGNRITSLPRLPDSLYSFSCNSNQLSSLPPLPDSLKYLNCSRNQLSSLPPLPPKLTFFTCDNNLLDSLPTLPSGLTTFSCRHNHLTSLPTLPQSIIGIFYFDYNRLTSLPYLPQKIYALNCSNNLLTTLPAIPDSSSISTIDIQCDSNQLTSLPPFPATLRYLTLRGNSTLTCLPEIISPLYTPPSATNNFNLDGFFIAGSGITCIPNYFTSYIFDVNPDSMQICGIGNSNGCPHYLMPDSVVWPGDANANHIVDNNDLLPIGLGYDSSGHARTVQSIVWQREVAVNWKDSFTVYAPTVNFKHADCNGDGIIDANDTLAILQNFSLTHAKTNSISSPWRSSIPELYAIPSVDTLYDVNILTVKLILGDSAIPVHNFYGIAFTYNFDPLVVDTNYTSMTFGNSWIGTNDKISISKILNNAGQIKAAATRIDHNTRNGNGAIASATFRINTQNVSNGSSYYYTNIGYISDVTAIDQLGNAISLNTGADTTHIALTPLGITSLFGLSPIHLYPNPNKGSFTLQTSANIGSDYTISDMLGHIVMQQSIRSNT